MTRVVERNPAVGGRDWVVGDVHGCFQTLRQALLDIEFEHGRDRLFSVGDLINRGPNSIEALDWLEQDRFEAVAMGNHEAEMVRLLQTGEILDPQRREQQWMRQIPRQDLFRWHRALRPLPLAVTVETPSGRVGIVHCNALDTGWNATIDALEARDITAINTVLLGPDEWREHERLAGNTISGIDCVIAGHQPVSEPECTGNRWNIDTGAGMSHLGRLTLARIDVDPLWRRTFDVIDD
ncbi:MAG: metallophosphoesterase [Gammaproteobacteria bacterium]|nr:metallophosphoesterase [Gammaproteobacteria bacterium]